MRIRLATPEDSGAAIEVVRAVYDEYQFTWDAANYHADLYDLERAYIAPGHPFFVAESRGGVPLGTIGVEMFGPLQGEVGELTEIDGMKRLCGCDCALTRLYVKRDARCCGVGTALMNMALDASRRARKSCMEIWSDKRFTDAHRLYTRLGAKMVGDRICDDPDESPEWGLTLWLGGCP